MDCHRQSLLHSPCCLSVLQGVHNGSSVFVINATDLDEGANAFLVFYLDDASNNLPFYITGNVVNAYGVLDYETQLRYFVSSLAMLLSSQQSIL